MMNTKLKIGLVILVIGIILFSIWLVFLTPLITKYSVNQYIRLSNTYLNEWHNFPTYLRKDINDIIPGATTWVASGRKYPADDLLVSYKNGEVINYRRTHKCVCTGPVGSPCYCLSLEDIKTEEDAKNYAGNLIILPQNIEFNSGDYDISDFNSINKKIGIISLPEDADYYAFWDNCVVLVTKEGDVYFMKM
ncbi:hypothetical protein J7K24_02000 [bacterium]|nr:hypothetical protein [bacterium]